MLFIPAVVLTGCLKDDTEQLQVEHDNELQSLLNKYNMTDADMLEDGIWMKVDPAGAVYPDSFPGENDYVVVDVVGSYASGEVFDVSDSLAARESGAYRNDLVYGPIRLKLNNTFYGYYMVMQEVPIGGSVTMVLSHEKAFGEFVPIAYKSKLYNTIPDINSYIVEHDAMYLDLMGIDVGESFEADSVYYIIREEGTDSIDLQLGDSLSVNLHAYYVEYDETYTTGFPGRQFFPINNSGTRLDLVAGEESFPFINNLLPIISVMTVGEVREVYMPAIYTYGDDGFRHPWVGKYIIPPKMSLHYRIELLNHKIN